MIILQIPNDYQPKHIRLIRQAKKLGALVIAEQRCVVAISKDSEFWVDNINAHMRFPSWLSWSLRMKLTKIRKRIGHFIYYWLIPIIRLEKPYVGKSSYLLRTGCSGLRDSDLQTYLCEQQKEIFIKNGVNPKKLIYQPIWKEIPQFKTEKIISVILPSDVESGLDRTTKAFISYKQQIKSWLMIISYLHEKYPDYYLYIKAHPDTKNFLRLNDYIHRLGILKLTIFLDRKDADKCIREAEIIVGVPPSFSSLLLQASFQYPWKKIYSVDIGNEMFGDYYKDYSNIKLITDINNL